jgi:hypothetical protein
MAQSGISLDFSSAAERENGNGLRLSKLIQAVDRLILQLNL